MPSLPAKSKIDMWPSNRATYYIETLAIILLAMLSMSLQYGMFDISILFSSQLVLRVLGSLCIWFGNRFVLDYILQSRINANKVTEFLPFELTIGSVIVTSVIYAIFYPIVSYLEALPFVFADFLQGFLLTIGLSLLIVMLYVGSQVWKSWWSDGEFLFRPKEKTGNQEESAPIITIKNAKGSVNHDLREVRYFISESKIVFLVDSSGKKWITQYNLSELEDQLDNRFFRLNRRILVSRQVISQIKKLPNHRLLVTIQQPGGDQEETISRYKSTRFKQWFDNSAKSE